MSATERKSRRGRRSNNSANISTHNAAFGQLPWQQLSMPYRPTEPVSEE